MTRVYTIEESSRLAEVRRAATVLAREEGLDETLTENVALIVTEVCTNLLKHAHGGEVCLSGLSERGEEGVEILSIDRGPGIADVQRCIADGYSTTGSSGTGLGAISRLAQEFDIYSEPGRGTTIVAQVRSTRRQSRLGAVVKPMTGEEISGDSWACLEKDGASTVMVADGLGHGVMAAKASAEAVATFRRARDLSPVAVLKDVHRALRSTRGAAVAVMHLTHADCNVKFAGIGNIGGVISASGKSQFMVSHAGTAGFGAPRLQVFSYSAPEGALIIMHSDGLTTNWNVDDHPGLRKHHPSLVAGVLYRDASRQRDDTCVVVLKSRRQG